MKYQKGFIGALIAILLVGGVYVYMQNRQANQNVVVQSSDLKTYSNARYGFEFKYPAASVIMETKDGVTLSFPQGESSDVTFTVSPVPAGKTININCHPVGSEDINSIVNGFHSESCNNLQSAGGMKYTRAINAGMSVEQLYRERTLSAYFLNSAESLTVRTLLTDASGNTLPSTEQRFDQIVNSVVFTNPATAVAQTANPQTASGTPITLATIDICSPLLKDASTLLFVDGNNKTWTVDFQNASFSEYSATTGTAQGTDGLLKTTLQDWLKSLRRVGQPPPEICGAPGKITITGTLAGGIVFASHIELAGQ